MPPAAASSSASKQYQQLSVTLQATSLYGKHEDATAGTKTGIYSSLLLAIFAESGMLARVSNSLTILLHAKFSTPKLRSSMGKLALSAMASAEILPARQHLMLKHHAPTHHARCMPYP